MRMKSSRKSNSVLDRRLREMEEESRQLRNRYKLLKKTMKRGGAGTPPASSAESSHESEREGWIRDGGPSNAAEDTRDTAWARGGEGPPGQRNRVRGDERFAHYFSTGGFKPLTPIGTDRSIQRNKAIFMVVIVIIFAYIIYYALIR